MKSVKEKVQDIQENTNLGILFHDSYRYFKRIGYYCIFSPRFTYTNNHTNLELDLFSFDIILFNKTKQCKKTF